jgi:membrane complex biogenesis BtpA family protein
VSELIAAMAAGTKAMIGMIALRPLAGSSRYRDGSLTDVIDNALAQADLLHAAGFTFTMVQNLGDLPVGRRVTPVQAAWMTRIAGEIRRAHRGPVGLNFLENDAAAMIAVASAAHLDFVRIKVFTGAMVTPSGVEDGQAFEALRARTAWRADDVAILADVHDRTATPVASAGLADDIRAAVAIGGADGIVLTGRSHRETLDFLATARDACAGRPVLVGGGVAPETIAEIAPLANGAIVGSALKAGGDLFGQLDLARARDFIATVAAVKASR